MLPMHSYIAQYNFFSIQESAKRLGQMIREKPFSSLQQATEWLEYLAKFKRLDQLQPQSHHLYLAQYLILDVIIFVLAIIIGVFALIGFCIRLCIRVCCKRSSQSAGQGKKKKE